ncbi:energy transducer TonB [Massilia genomosp. 1]|uniref:TonB family protein n=1 Tax=Massilia genomosp. 1 TaxID=2609280 RepID=A0ABX0MNQ8_9BURK|nr:TonB family protein [Massilia genomosp. 1]NHZ62230.1 TonB family protein [Massilia genomosp. 1]
MRHFLFPACLLLLAQPAQVHAASPARTPAFLVPGSCPAPQWPTTRIRVDELDPVRIAFVIGADGRVLTARVEQSAGHRLWDEATIVALSRCRFRAARLGTKPVQGVIKMQHVWTLD